MDTHQTGRLLAASAMAFLLWQTVAHSAAIEVPFGANVQSTCTIAVQQSGILVQNPNARRLTSASAGGSHARVQVTATSNNFDLTADAPSAFDTQPAGYSGTPTFQAAIRGTGSGANSFPWTSNSQPLGAGNSNVRVRLVAISDAATSFPDGNYSATVQLRCE